MQLKVCVKREEAVHAHDALLGSRGQRNSDCYAIGSSVVIGVTLKGIRHLFSHAIFSRLSRSNTTHSETLVDKRIETTVTGANVQIGR